MLLLLLLEDKIPSVNDIYEKIKRENRCITLTDYDKFMKDIFDAKIMEKALVNKSYLNEKVKTLAPNEEIKTSAKKSRIKSRAR